MYTSLDYKNIHKEFKKSVKDRSGKLFKIWLTIFLIIVTGLVVLFIFIPKILQMDPWDVIVPIYGFVPAFVTLLLTIVSYNYVSEKPSYTYLYPEIYKKINLEESLFIKYESYLKGKPDFNNIGGLYTRHASVRVKRKISGQTLNGNEFSVYDATIITSNGKSSSTHFNGIYFQVKTDTSSFFQIRTHGSPKFKDMKFIKQDEFQDLKVYLKEDMHMSNKINAYIDFVRKHKSDFNVRTFDLSVIPGETHLGIWYKKHSARRQKSISVDKLNELYHYFMSELQMADQLVELNNPYYN
ncbi:MAG: hypothetical protein JXC31_04150 [Acholeplasmataceae bacterium]|nr:hypothetical protein [Acholeplasmataceae bacterium]